MLKKEYSIRFPARSPLDQLCVGINGGSLMLAIVVSDALNGVDIITRHRRFYAAMLADPLLHDAFITALELLEDQPRPEPDPPPLNGTLPQI